MEKRLKQFRETISKKISEIAESPEVKTVRQFGRDIKKIYNEAVDDYKSAIAEKKEAEKEELDETEKYNHIDENYIHNCVTLEEKEKIQKELEYFPVKLNRLEYLKYKAFEAEHLKTCIKEREDGSKSYPYVEVTTCQCSGIGTNHHCKCTTCHKFCDITDYGAW